MPIVKYLAQHCLPLSIPVWESAPSFILPKVWYLGLYSPSPQWTTSLTSNKPQEIWSRSFPPQINNLHEIWYFRAELLASKFPSVPQKLFWPSAVQKPELDPPLPVNDLLNCLGPEVHWRCWRMNLWLQRRRLIVWCRLTAVCKQRVCQKHLSWSSWRCLLLCRRLTSTWEETLRSSASADTWETNRWTWKVWTLWTFQCGRPGPFLSWVLNISFNFFYFCRGATSCHLPAGVRSLVSHVWIDLICLIMPESNF